MFSIPHTFANEDESYITIPALRRFAKEKGKDDLKTTVDRPQLIEDIEKYANQSEEKQEEVLDWLDQVLVEGIKDVQIKYLDDTFQIDLLENDEYVEGILNPALVDNNNCHLCGGNYNENLRLYKYEIVPESAQGRRIKMYLGKLLSTFDKNKGSAKTPYPIFVELFLDKSLIVARAKSKSGLYKYMEDFVLEAATSTSAEKQMGDAIEYVCKLFAIDTASTFEAIEHFKNQLYLMLEKYTKTPKEIVNLMNDKTDEIDKMVDSLMKGVCNLPDGYKEDVKSNVLNMVEKYFSISYPDKKIFTRDRDAYPLRLNATDEEDSKVEQTAAMEAPLQSKAIFFDNKKMLQKSQSCDGVSFMFNRINTLYCTRQFKVKIVICKDFCTLKFTEYTMEEDIIHVLFSFIGTTGVAE